MPRQTAMVEIREVPVRGAARDVAINERGAALLETASPCRLCCSICVGIFEFGRAYQTWQVLTNAAREGARVAVVSGTTGPGGRRRAVRIPSGDRTARERPSAAPIAVNRPGRRSAPPATRRHRGHDPVPVLFHRARPGSAVRKAGIHHWRPDALTAVAIMRNEPA